MSQIKTTYVATKQEILGATIPAESKTYKPFSHQEVIDITLNSIATSGFTLDKESYSSCRDHNVAVGRYTIKDVADPEMQLEISWLNSYNKTKRLTWGIGSQVRICMNGMISADMGAFKKKHQGNIQDYSPRAIVEYVKRAADVFRQMQRERDEMKQIEVNKTITAHILGEMFLQEDFITTTQLNIIKREISNPTHDYNSDKSMWELYNFVTFSLKDLHPSLYLTNHMDAHRYFVNKSGFIVPKSQIEVQEVGTHPQLDLFDSTPKPAFTLQLTD
jgi:hypothetical protein